jgi:hypothetical protein
MARRLSLRERLTPSSAPITQEIHLVPHHFGRGSRAKTQHTAQLLADGELLLRRQNHTGMLSSAADPQGVKPIEIGDVERVEDTLMLSGKGQLPLVGPSVRRTSKGVITMTPRERRAATRSLSIASSSM